MNHFNSEVRSNWAGREVFITLWREADRGLPGLDRFHLLSILNFFFSSASQDCHRFGDDSEQKEVGQSVGFSVVNVTAVTRGQRDINLHVISEAVIEWLQKWRGAVCFCRVMRLSSCVCVCVRVWDGERQNVCASVNGAQWLQVWK